MRVEGAPYPPGRAPCIVGTSCALRTLFSCTILLLVGKNSLYNHLKVLTSIPREHPLFLFRAVSAADLEQDVFSGVSRGESGVSSGTRAKSKQRC